MPAVKSPKIDPLAAVPEKAREFVRAQGIKRVKPEELAIFNYATAMTGAGCPPDQIRNFIQAGIWLQPKQIEFAAAARSCDRDGGPVYIGFGGPRGPGKSFVAIGQIAADDAQRYPGLKILFLRKVGRAAKEQFEDVRIKLLCRLKHDYRQGKDLTFDNGSRIIIGHFKDEKEIDNYLGQEYDVMLIEELTTLSKEKVTNLLSCLRTSKPGWRPRLYATWNWGGLGHCVPFGEVLTPTRGWVPIHRIKPGDKIYTVLPNGQMVESKAEQVHVSRFVGNIKVVKQSGLYMACTPNHKVARMLDLTDMVGRDAFAMTPFCELPGHVKIVRSVGWEGVGVFGFTVRPVVESRKNHQPDTITGDQWMELVGWYASEGYSLLGKGKNRFGICQSKMNYRVVIEALLTDCGFRFCKNAKSFDVYSKKWAEYFSQFGKCREKHLPPECKGATKRQLRILFNAMVSGDGCWTDNIGGSGQYYTISDRLADDFQEVAVKLGYITTVNRRQRENRFGKEIRISFKTTNGGCSEILTGNHQYAVSTKTKRSPCVSDEPYDGMVYCIGVPETHSFILRQKGSAWISGNSWVKQMFWDPFIAKKESKTHFIRARVYDNKHNNKEYLQFLESLTGWKRQSWLEGNPDFQAGQFFTNWDAEVHVLKAFDERKIVRWMGGFDYGRTHPAVFELAGEDRDGNLIFLDEHSAPDLGPEEHAAAIFSILRPRNLMPSDLDFIAAGKDCFSTKDDGTTIADTYSELGIQLVPAEIDRINGWAKMLARLGEPARGIRPTMFFHERCKEVIGQIPLAQHDEKRPEDVEKMNASPEDAKGGDDAIDCTRFVCATNPGGPLKFCQAVAVTPWAAGLIEERPAF
jgi:hypothetical protein